MSGKELAKKVYRKLFGQKVYVERVTKPYVVNILKEGRFKNKVVIVTGGSGTIGRSVACRLALEGAVVIITGRNESKLKEVKSEINNGYGISEYVVADILKENEVENLFNQVISKYGKLDYLVNVAGGGSRDKMAGLDEQSMDVVRSVIETNLMGTMTCCKYAGREMKKRGEGRIVNTSSIVGVRGLARYSEYAATKAAVTSFTQSLAMELGKWGITVNVVSPGIVQRGVVADDALSRIQSTNFLNSFGTPEDIANMIAFLLSDEASFITGQNFIVDGGRSLGLKGV
ncbi:SDR family NAD(P)-dependent oxidoreductase [Phocaeicola sartorii]|uniref:SDR family NAD(P)-dependent oxidoreductase n=1 Tax=Phocaeicola sartorii TaxID=671267 RepID=UPI0013643CBE|nr:SDR family oxidoreductase [Phocaeicola sartorii]NBH67024.1 SDR family oxidoreductase [Phocaeicola sartorii]